MTTIINTNYSFLFMFMFVFFCSKGLVFAGWLGWVGLAFLCFFLCVCVLSKPLGTGVQVWMSMGL